MHMRRNKIEITKDILEMLNTGKATKTKIVYSVNLNFKRADRYLEQLYGMKLVDHSSKTYHITELGREYLKKVKDIDSIFSNVKR